MFSQQKEFNLGVGLVFLMLAISGAVAALPDLVDNSKQSRTLYVEGELLVKAKKGYSISSAKQFISSSGDVVAKQVDNKGLMLVKLSKNDTVKAAMARYKSTSAYELVQPNFRYYATSVINPNDADYGELWGLKNTAQVVTGGSYTTNNPGTLGNDIDAESAWSIHSDCSAVTVAVVDTGIYYEHPELTGNKWINTQEQTGVQGVDDDKNGFVDDIYGYDTVDGDGDPMSTDLAYHGTHVAGTIGATGDNTLGMTGVCQKSKIMSVRVLGIDGGTTVGVVEGVNYAVANGAKVINMSLGGGGNDPSFDTAITNAGTNGVIVVVAAGNDGVDTDISAAYPCNYTQSNLVCVAALDQAYSLASFSNFGSTHVDIGAPGTNIHSTWVTGSTLSSETFADWTLGGNWAKTSCTLSSGSTYDSLVNPAPNCDGTYGPYTNNLNDIAYKTFNLSGQLGASVEYFARVKTEPTVDTFSMNYDSTASSNAFDGTNDVALVKLSGDKTCNTLGQCGYLKYEHGLSKCLTSTCTIGTQLKTDNTVTSDGVGIILMKVNAFTAGNNTFSAINGTSMATPHAAGVAALVYSYNPTYTADEVATAIRNSGETTASLATTTTTGRALNAFNALRYIQTPTGVTAVVQ